MVALSPDGLTMEVRHGSGCPLMIAKHVELRDHLRLRFETGEEGRRWLARMQESTGYDDSDR
jgi:hypothetical protein